MYQHDTICNVLHFSGFDHTSCGKHDVPGYGVEESNSIGVHEVTENCDIPIMIKYGFWNTCYLNSLHMLDLSPHCFAF